MDAEAEANAAGHLWDCVVVGGGAAGLSAALVLGRARRATLVVDAGEPSNLPAHGIGGLLGHDGRSPAELYELGRAELARYPSVEVRAGTVATGRRLDDGTFAFVLADGTEVRSRTAVLATGMAYQPVDLPGLAERWGRTVFHCPFCHGWEVRDGRLAVLSPGDTGLIRAQLLRMWSDDVTLLTDGPTSFGPADRDRLASLGVAVDERRVAAVRGDGEAVEAVVFEDGTELACDAVLVASALEPRDDLAGQLGADLTATPLSTRAVAVDGQAATSVPGLFAAGDLTGELPSVAAAIAGGSRAAAQVVHHLAVV
jgi:thioredoxin reductase